MNRPLAVYVHIPFCTVKCGYCDFNAYAGMDNLKADYGRALVREIRQCSSLLRGREISSIGFGGGTPGEVPASDIASVIEAVREHAAFRPDIEISLEANPGTVTDSALRELQRAGVNRLSLGAQSFHGPELKFLDRIHSPDATISSLRLAREAGIPSVGLDLIYGLPGQSLEAWRASLERAIAFDPDHISTYALTVEPGTPLARRVERREAIPLDEDQVADQYDLASSVLAEAGYQQYELSNWAKPGHQSRHNRTYWTDGDYLGIGAGAHGYYNRERYENVAHPREYIAAVNHPESHALPAVQDRYLPDEAIAMSDWFALRLRLIEGFESADFTARFGAAIPPSVAAVFREMCEAGVVAADPRIHLTARGRMLHGEVAARILVALQGA
ncbi:MAG: radical SAM family heme chaperone HemW [Dehalococcoidia bacterium]